MAVGDVVNFQSAVNTSVQFQPAVTVDVMLTCIAIDGATTNYVQLKDGVVNPARFTIGIVSYQNSKICLNNTRWLLVDAIVGITVAGAGIQTK